MSKIQSALGVSLASLVSLQLAAQNQERVRSNLPNIVLIFMDDMGYGDLGCYGANQYTTPNIDRLAIQGMRFTHFYVPQAVSSASRAGLLTGCYPNRVGITGALMPWSQIGINSEEVTIAEMLKTRGYYTGIIGKWHLGHQFEFLPLQNGFDEYYGLPYSNDMWPVDFDGIPMAKKDPGDRKNSYPVLSLIEGNEKIREIRTLEDQCLLTTLYTERAIKFIENHKNKPFFLYIAHSMVHVPLGVSEKFRSKSNEGMYGDVMMEVDWSVGEVMKALKKSGLEDNTLVIYTSDNGPWLNFGNHAGSTGGLREGKGTSWEGGQRVPCIMKWPGVIPDGQICNKIACTIDILPTLAAITGALLPANKIDGVSILPLLKGDEQAFPRRFLYYYYNVNSLEAVQRDYWKLVLPHKYRSYVGVLPGNDGWPGNYAADSVRTFELYDLRRDPGERYNVYDLYPEIIKELMLLVEEARCDLGDDITNNPGKYRRQPGIASKKSDF
jgi:arylsulfatase A-like enzyme